MLTLLVLFCCPKQMAFSCYWFAPIVTEQHVTRHAHFSGREVRFFARVAGVKKGSMGGFEGCFGVLGFLTRKTLKTCANKNQNFCVCREGELLYPVLALLMTLIPDADWIHEQASIEDFKNSQNSVSQAPHHKF